MPTIEYIHRRIDDDGTEHLPGSTAKVSEEEAANAESYGYGFRVPERRPTESAEAPGPTENAAEATGRVEPRAVDATDAAEELADEHGIDLSEIEGSGKGGRILKGDIEAELV